MCKVVVLFIKAFILDVFVAVASLNLKVPNLKKILDYKHSPHQNTICRYTSRVNLILTNLRTKIHKWYSASLGEQTPMLQRVQYHSLIC